MGGISNQCLWKRVNFGFVIMLAGQKGKSIVLTDLETGLGVSGLKVAIR